MRIPLSPTQAPALAIALFVRERGAAYSAEILNAFDISESTLRRRRSQLRWLGIDFVPRGRGSFYSDSRLTGQFPTGDPCLDSGLRVKAPEWLPESG
jgi:hypothetical protein